MASNKPADAAPTSDQLVPMKDLEQKKKDLFQALERLVKAEDIVDKLTPQIQRQQEIGQSMDAKRRRELGRVQRDFEESHFGRKPETFDKDVQEQLNNGLLRMAELRVMSEMRVEELEKELKEKDNKLAAMETDMDRMLLENQQMRARLQQLEGKPFQFSIDASSGVKNNANAVQSDGSFWEVGATSESKPAKLANSLNQREALRPSQSPNIHIQEASGSMDEEDAFWMQN